MNGAAKQIERRRYSRVTFRRTVTVRLSRWSSLELMGHDISRGGMKLTLPAGVKPGDRVAIGLTLPNDLQLEIEAEVRFIEATQGSDKCVAGLQFVPGSADAAEMLGQLVDGLGGVNRRGVG